MGEVIVITSGKGGVGKTTTTANLGSALALAGKRVALVDTDIGLRNLDVVLGLENRIVYDLVDVIEEKCKLRQALIKDKRFKELFLLPAACSSYHPPFLYRVLLYHPEHTVFDYYTYNYYHNQGRKHACHVKIRPAHEYVPAYARSGSRGAECIRFIIIGDGIGSVSRPGREGKVIGLAACKSDEILGFYNVPRCVGL